MKKIIQRLVKKKVISKDDWDKQYGRGVWSFLNSIDELAHNSIIIGYLQFFNKMGSILDVGCGEGILQEKLYRIGYRSYTGLDISGEAIKKAKRKKYKQTEFIESTVDEFTTKKKFDAIVFNEILYYLENPLLIIKKYEQYLASGGIIVISMFSGSKSRSIWKKLALEYSFDETSVANKKGNHWICKCFQKQ